MEISPATLIPSEPSKAPGSASGAGELSSSDISEIDIVWLVSELIDPCSLNNISGYVDLYQILLPVKRIADQEMTNFNNIAFIYV